MNKTQLISKVAQQTNQKVSTVETVINEVLSVMKGSLSTEEGIALGGFGSFVVKRRQERRGRDPRTKELIQIPASNTVGFRPAKALKELVN